ncbi:hypothetical protein Ciccas_004981 [Cichlidogyrus casuarinus]|uniref:Uncharacterized protein n=1 Tax=Cichlidogyrus casuarinus TaxID=1844966 RepID=A0ABD2QA16_9PLAT
MVDSRLLRRFKRPNSSAVMCVCEQSIEKNKYQMKRLLETNRKVHANCKDKRQVLAVQRADGSSARLRQVGDQSFFKLLHLGLGPSEYVQIPGTGHAEEKHQHKRCHSHATEL